MRWKAKCATSCLPWPPEASTSWHHKSTVYYSTVQYYLMFGAGDTNSLVNVDVDAVESQVRDIMPSLATRGVNLMAP